MNAGGGDDVVLGSAGDDSLVGGDGTNTLDYSGAGAPVTVDLAGARANGADIGSDTVSGFGVVNTGTGADSVVGTGAAETLNGGAGGDTITGGGGADSIIGGAGNDSLSGGADSETIDGGVNNDTIVGSLGNDTLIGGDGRDGLNYTGSTAAVTVDFANNAANGADIGTDSIVGFEQVATGSGDDTVVGGTGNETIASGGGADTVVGGGGFDVILGGSGNDSLVGGVGNETIDGGGDDDVVVGSAGNDSLVGGDGTNTLDYSRAFLDVVADLGTGTAQDGFGGTDVVSGFAVVVTGEGEDSVVGSAANETLDGGGGADTLVGGAGADSIVGGLGNDSLVGGDDNDTLLGGEGDDFVLGGAGDDSIVATPGRDTIEGQAGNDVIDTGEDDDLVIWRVGDGNDVISMGSGNDTLDLEGWTGDDTDFWSVNAGGAGAIYTYDDGAGNAFTLTTSGVETVTCFAPGTRILTAGGEVPVETLRAGDLVVAPGRGAALKPVRWVGHTRVDIARHRDKRKVAPILVRAGALGAGVPARDLRVSPEHAFLLQGRLVPAHMLVNGTTIVQELWQRAITYWHVELDEHGVLVAEGALAESYFDDGNRHLFDNGVIALHVDFGAAREGGRYATDAFAPPVLDADDPALVRIRAALPVVTVEAAAKEA